VVRGFESVSGYYHSSFHRVRCLSPHSHLIYLFCFSGLGVAVSISTVRAMNLINSIPLEYWCNLWSTLDFAEQPLKSCVNVIHIDIIEIWNLYDRSRVSFPQLPCRFNCSTASVSVEQPIQDEYVPRRQRSSDASCWCTTEVSVLFNKWMCPVN